MERRVCGARTRQGSPCQRAPVPGRSRCVLHGGRATGARTAAGRTACAQAATVHGIYSRRFTEEEVQEILEIEGTDKALEFEIRVARVTVDRALALWQKWRENGAEALELAEVVEDGDTVTTRRKRPDFFAIVDRALARVGRLVEQRARVVEVRDLQEQLEQLKARLPHTERTA